MACSSAIKPLSTTKTMGSQPRVRDCNVRGHWSGRSGTADGQDNLRESWKDCGVADGRNLHRACGVCDSGAADGCRDAEEEVLSYDTRCEELAELFLADEIDSTPEDLASLAQAIQDAIERWFEQP